MKNLLKQFDEKVIVITGASSGLGRVLAIHLSKYNTKLVLAARNFHELTQTANQCLNPQNVYCVETDVSKEADCKHLIEKTITKFGCLDFLINNAGISMWKRFGDVNNLELFKNLITVNYLGAVYCSYYALPFLRQSNGMIIVISSIQGLLGVPFHTGYSASKFALQGFFESLRLEENKINILLVSPGWIKDTQLRERATQRKPNHKSHAISVNVCAHKIVKAILKKRKYLLMPWYFKALIIFNSFTPRFIGAILKKSVKE